MEQQLCCALDPAVACEVCDKGTCYECFRSTGGHHIGVKGKGFWMCGDVELSFKHRGPAFTAPALVRRIK